MILETNNFPTTETRWIPLGRSGGQIATTVKHHGVIDDIHGMAYVDGRAVRFVPERIKELISEYRHGRRYV